MANDNVVAPDGENNRSERPSEGQGTLDTNKKSSQRQPRLPANEKGDKTPKSSSKTSSKGQSKDGKSSKESTSSSKHGKEPGRAAKRKRTNELSDSDGESILGYDSSFEPIYPRASSSSEQSGDSNADAMSPQHSGQAQQNQFPWGPYGYPMPGPYGMSSMPMPGQMPMPMQPYWYPMPMQTMEEESEDESTEEGELNDESEKNTEPEPQPGVSLLKHKKLTEEDDGVGPPVLTAVADLVTGLWNKPVKEEIKDLYAAIKRPQNIPVLQKVSMDEDVLGIMNATKKTHDFSLRALNNAFVQAAAATTQLVDLCMNSDDKTDIRQRVIDSAVDTIRILAYGAQTTHQIRKEQVRPILPHAVKNKLCSKQASLEEINSSHLLFGGEVPVKVKKGTYIHIIIH